MNVWSWGANSYGQLAQGDTDDRLVPKPIGTVPGRLTRISCGGGHTLLLTEDGRVYVCGCNNKGQLGTCYLQNFAIFTALQKIKERVVDIAGGWDFSLAVTDTGSLYAWGSNAFGQLGDPSLQAITPVPTQINIPCQVIQVAAGLRHTVALLVSGEVYCWGHAKKGQCGQQGESRLPLKLDLPSKVEITPHNYKCTQIVAGSYHSAALTAQGSVLFWGCNKHGQGAVYPKVTQQISVPMVIDQDLFGGERVKVIKSGWTHLLAQTESGLVYSWGRGDYGQLGRSRSPDIDHIPGVMDISEKITQLECGSEHNLLLTETGRLYAVGWNEHGLCGTGDETNVERPTPIATLSTTTVQYIACGGGHCFAVTTDYG
ncbi:secretion-regulating guanine nucleotide exchange factor-like isoform X1 [Dreissena polymorpha]|uniref:RCC1-like domain-containing protein n=1 Tax=Dreissena polymorpha TaxID=45954 RepID=A0A9D4MYK6_DREPO|nr:secretion-regulating guanine nucleotide exchange factor-like isoform X1 [Dreissena polymorpha]KAH3886308.1 hypothetical protein DPMN_010312 [Dreissena polymorpha]